MQRLCARVRIPTCCRLPSSLLFSSIPTCTQTVSLAGGDWDCGIGVRIHHIFADMLWSCRPPSCRQGLPLAAGHVARRRREREVAPWRLQPLPGGCGRGRGGAAGWGAALCRALGARRLLPRLPLHTTVTHPPAPCSRPPRHPPLPCHPVAAALLQVLLSLQSMVFIADPWYNEPAYDRMRGTQEGASSSLKYNAGGWARGRARAGRGWGGGGREGGNGC